MADIAKLKQAGIHTVNGAHMTTRRQMTKIKGFSEAKIEKIKEACSKLIVSPRFLVHLQAYSKAILVFPKCSRDFPVSEKGLFDFYWQQILR